MAKLIYAAMTSLDGFIEDEHGSFDWAEPDEEVHAFVNDLERRVRTHLLGRRLYEVMVSWETLPLAGAPRPVQEFAELWRAADKVVYSRTLETVTGARTRIEREFVPEAVRALKLAADGDVAVGGAELAGRAFETALVDELHLVLAPVVVGGGKPALPRDLRLDFELMSERRFTGGFVYLGYRAAP